MEQFASCRLMFSLHRGCEVKFDDMQRSGRDRFYVPACTYQTRRTTDVEFKIDPEFKTSIPPLSEEEKEQLEAMILADGVIINPLIVWNGILVDGHNRLEIIQKHPEIKYTVFEKDFPDRYAALAYIYKNQLGRRNLTPELRRYLIGKQYSAEKASMGGSRGNQYTKMAGSQDGNLPNPKKTCERIAKENNIGKNTVIRAETYSKAIDAAEDVLPGTKNRFLSGQIKPTEKDIAALARAAPEEIPALLEEIENSKQPAAQDSRDSDELPLGYIDMDQLTKELQSAPGGGSEADMFFELEDAMKTMIFRWTVCLCRYERYYKINAHKERIKEIIHIGKKFLKRIEGGRNPYDKDIL